MKVGVVVFFGSGCYRGIEVLKGGLLRESPFILRVAREKCKKAQQNLNLKKSSTKVKRDH